MVTSYRTDLAYIHDAGFASHAEHASRLLLDQLSKSGLRSGLIVDLGCGSGILAREVACRGYDVMGVDISPAMVALARHTAPSAQFKIGSLLEAQIPACVGVTAVGECFNYLFDPRNRFSRLDTLFKRIFRSLRPGGLFLFDIATPDRLPRHGTTLNLIEDPGWTVVVESARRPGTQIIERHITTFRKVGKSYRRDSETHSLILLDPTRIAGRLREIGFRVRPIREYSGMPLLPGVVGFLARKPVTR